MSKCVDATVLGAFFTKINKSLSSDSESSSTSQGLKNCCKLSIVLFFTPPRNIPFLMGKKSHRRYKILVWSQQHQHSVLPNLNSTLKYYEQNSGWIKPVIISDIFVRLHFALKTFSGYFFSAAKVELATNKWFKLKSWIKSK